MRSYTVTRIWGIPIRVNVSLLVFLPLLAWLIGSGQQITLYASIIERFTPVVVDVDTLTAGNTPWLVGITAAFGLFVSVTVHELGHSWVARRFGLEIESITLWIFGGLARFEDIPREWDREFWIAIAGPVTSVLVGVVCAGVVQAIPAQFPVVVFVTGWLAIVNVTLAVFNLLPAFPMDGGRVLRALLARTRPYAVATLIAARVGVAFALVFAIVGVFGFNPILILIALFVYGAAKSEARVTMLDALLEGLTVGDIMDAEPDVLNVDDTLSAFVSQMLQHHQTSSPVVDEWGVVVGLVTLQQLRSVDRADYDTTTVGAVMLPPPMRVDATTGAFEALSLLAQQGSEYALVEDRGRVVGTVSQAAFLAAIEIQQSLPRPV